MSTNSKWGEKSKNKSHKVTTECKCNSVCDEFRLKLKEKIKNHPIKVKCADILCPICALRDCRKECPYHYANYIELKGKNIYTFKHCVCCGYVSTVTIELTAESRSELLYLD